MSLMNICRMNLVHETSKSLPDSLLTKVKFLLNITKQYIDIIFYYNMGPSSFSKMAFNMAILKLYLINLLLKGI